MQSQKTLKASHDTAMAKVDELTGQLKEERLRSLGLEKQLQSKALQERRATEVLLKAQKSCRQFNFIIYNIFETTIQ